MRFDYDQSAIVPLCLPNVRKAAGVDGACSNDGQVTLPQEPATYRWGWFEVTDGVNKILGYCSRVGHGREVNIRWEQLQFGGFFDKAQVYLALLVLYTSEWEGFARAEELV